MTNCAIHKCLLYKGLWQGPWRSQLYLRNIGTLMGPMPETFHYGSAQHGTL